MSGVRLCPSYFLSAFVIEGANQIGTALQRFWGADILKTLAFPEAAIPAIRLKPTILFQKAATKAGKLLFSYYSLFYKNGMIDIAGINQCFVSRF